jgi:hypothetical protein
LHQLVLANYASEIALVTVTPSGFVRVKISKVNSNWGYWFLGFNEMNGLGGTVPLPLGSQDSPSNGYVESTGSDGKWYSLTDTSGVNGCPGSMPLKVCLGKWYVWTYPVDFPAASVATSTTTPTSTTTTAPPETTTSTTIPPSLATGEVAFYSLDTPPAVRPGAMYWITSACSPYLSGIHWTQWTKSVAIGTGTLETNNGVPSCSGGSWTAHLGFVVTLKEPKRLSYCKEQNGVQTLATALFFTWTNMWGGTPIGPSSPTC